MAVFMHPEAELTIHFPVSNSHMKGICFCPSQTSLILHMHKLLYEQEDSSADDSQQAQSCHQLSDVKA